MCPVIANANVGEELPFARYERNTFYGIDWRAYFRYTTLEDRRSRSACAADVGLVSAQLKETT